MDIVVCNGTKKYVNNFYAELWIDLDLLKITKNLFEFPMQLHATNQKIGRVKQQNGWISAIDSYLTLSHQSLYKEDDAPKILY